MVIHPMGSQSVKNHTKSNTNNTKDIQIALDLIHVHGTDKYNVPIFSVELEYWLVVSTPLKNISQSGNLPNRGENTKYLKAPPRIFFLQSPKKNTHKKNVEPRRKSCCAGGNGPDPRFMLKKQIELLVSIGSSFGLH